MSDFWESVKQNPAKWVYLPISENTQYHQQKEGK